MKKRIGIVTLALAVSTMAFLPTLASAAGDPGFYNLGTATGVTATPQGAAGDITVSNVDVDADGTADAFYPNSTKIKVSYNAATAGAYYGILLVEGDAVPTKENAIYYIDQVTAESSTVDFLVYPILPSANGKLTMYISSSDANASLVKVPVYYTTSAEAGSTTPEFTLGDLDNNGIWNSGDASKVLQIGAGLVTPTDAEKLAADVNSDTFFNSADASKILQYGAGLIESLN